MKDAWWVVVGCFAFCALVLFPVAWLLRRAEVVDRPNHRSSHRAPTIRGGGLAIIMTIVFGALTIHVVGGNSNYVGILLPLIFLTVVSFIDDLRSVGVILRFTAQTVAAIAGLWWICHGSPTSAQGAGIPYGAWPILIFWIVGYTNAFNFMDGIDGLAAIQAIMTALGMGVISAEANGNWTSAPTMLCFAVSGAALGFLPHNFPRARIFMGDAGSAPLGFMLACLTIWLAQEHGFWLLVPLACLHANFILDTAITLTRRILRGEQWHKPHREHFYQRLVRADKTHRFVTLIEFSIQCAVVVLMFFYIRGRLSLRIYLVGLVVGLWCMFFAYAERRFKVHK